MKRTSMIIAFSLLMGVGALVLLAGVIQIAKAKSSNRSDFVEAKLEQCELRDSFIDSSTVYSVAVKYKYEVNGVVYTSSKLADGYSASSDEQFHRELHRRLQESKGLKAWYSPEHPEDAVLTKSSYGFGYHLAILGSVFIVITAGCLAMIGISSKAAVEFLNNLE